MSVTTPPTNLALLFRGLEALYRADSGLDPQTVLLPFRADAGVLREALLLREAEDGVLELALALEQNTLHAFEAVDAHRALADDALAGTLPVLEGLSHLLYVAEAARCNRPVSGLELETQAEVDKLALLLLHRWQDAREAFHPLVERLYRRFENIAAPDLQERYEMANRLALAFSRRLWPSVRDGRLGDLHRLLRRFWAASMSDKHALAA